MEWLIYTCYIAKREKNEEQRKNGFDQWETYPIKEKNVSLSYIYTYICMYLYISIWVYSSCGKTEEKWNNSGKMIWRKRKDVG